jgi:hypothetical protein
MKPETQVVLLVLVIMGVIVGVYLSGIGNCCGP